ncbi:MAG: hypothetical protein RDV48_03555 [Candidatus Eremiobacteraeota bacterium]|nr:hypothetical protein [Candidatus Eremiobacteraeota bacterium]
MDNLGSVYGPSFSKGPLMLVGWNAREDKLSVQTGTTFIDYPGTDKDVMIRCEQDSIIIDRKSDVPAVIIKRNGDDIEVHKEGQDADVRIKRSGNEIYVDRKGMDEDVTISRQGTLVIFDRMGQDRDVKISSTSDHGVNFPVYITWEGEVIEQV